jgi:hypothetical protein
MSKISDEVWFSTHSLTPFKSCSSICLNGITGSGKTHFIRRFLQEVQGMYTESSPVEILYCYNILQDVYEIMEREIANFRLFEGLPTKEQIDDFIVDKQHRLLIFDDLQDVIKNSTFIEQLFTAGCHHRYISIMYVTQNLFQRGSNSRTIALNSYYQILFPSNRDVSQVATLGRQLYGGESNALMQAYKDVLENNYGYLVVDNSPGGVSQYRLRTRIFPGDDPIVYHIA